MHVLARTFVGAYPDLINEADIRGEPVGQGLGDVGVVLAAAGPVGVAVVHPLLRDERVLDGLVGEVVGAGGADAAHDELHGGFAGHERAGEVGEGRVLPLAGPVLGVLAGLGRGGRRRAGHHDRAGEGGGLRAYPPAQALAEFVLDHCMGWEGKGGDSGADQRPAHATTIGGELGSVPNRRHERETAATRARSAGSSRSWKTVLEVSGPSQSRKSQPPPLSSASASVSIGRIDLEAEARGRPVVDPPAGHAVGRAFLDGLVWSVPCAGGGGAGGGGREEGKGGDGRTVREEGVGDDGTGNRTEFRGVVPLRARLCLPALRRGGCG